LSLPPIALRGTREVLGSGLNDTFYARCSSFCFPEPIVQTYSFLE